MFKPCLLLIYSSTAKGMKIQKGLFSILII